MSKLSFILPKAYCQVGEFIMGNTLLRLAESHDVVFSKKLPYCDDNDLYYITCSPLIRDRPLPLFLYIHGGGWISGAPEYRRAILSNIAARGYIAVGIFYGLAPKYRFPSPVVSLYTLLAHLIKNAEWHGIDTSRIYAGGESAGASLAVSLGAISSNEEYRDFFELPEQSKNTRFLGIAPICGLYDLPAALESGFPLIKTYISAYSYRLCEDILKDGNSKYLSPLRFINEGFPQTFIITGGRDKLQAQGFLLDEKLKSLNVPCYHLFDATKSAIHAFPVAQFLESSKSALTKMLGFFNEALLETSSIIC